MGAVRHCIWFMLVENRMQLASEIVGETVEREVCRVAEEATSAIIAAAIDDGRGSVGHVQRNISDDSDRDG